MIPDKNVYLIASTSVAGKLRNDEDVYSAMAVCPWIEDGRCFIVPEEAWNEMIEKSEPWKLEE